MGKILESAENYLEAIFVLQDKQEIVKAVDIAHYLKFSKPSVSTALKHLKDHSLIDITEKNHILLTTTGLLLAKKTYTKHLTIKKLFIMLGVSEETADNDACKTEHVLSEETFLKIEDFLKINSSSYK